MARVKNNPLLRGITGKLGGLVFRQVGTETIVSAAATPRTTHSPRQQAQLAKFAAAVRYAKAQMQDPAARALYATGTNARHAGAYNVALADYLHGPTITSTSWATYTGQAGQPIYVGATDNFGVVTVTVHIQAPDGTVLEEGAAQPQPGGQLWVYVTQQPHALRSGATITLRATDRPGNEAIAVHIYQE